MYQENYYWQPGNLDQPIADGRQAMPLFDPLALLREGAALAKGDPPQAGNRRDIAGIRQDAPAPAQSILTAEQLRDLPGLVSMLDNGAWRFRDAATRALINAGPQALPHILRILDSNDREATLEQRNRCEHILREIKNNKFPDLLDGLTATDSAVRNATARVLSTIPTRDLLEATSRVALDLTDAQRNNLRTLVLGRSSQEELERLYSERQWGQSNVPESTLRRTLGLAVLTGSENQDKLSLQLGRLLFEQGPAHFTEAARLLERTAQNNSTEYFSLQTLGAIRLAQGDPQRWLTTAQRYLPSIGRLEGNGLGYWIPESHTNFQRQAQQLLNLPGLTPEQRTQIQQLQQQSQQLHADYLRRSTPDRDGKKRN